MTQTSRKIALLSCMAGTIGIYLLTVVPQSTTAVQADDSTKPAGIQPVETNMHEFMEYYYQPTYKRLKAAMASEPADKAGWKTIKADSLILAEGGNLLLSRVPVKDSTDWIAHSVATRTLGAELYQAARKSDYATARAKYESMITNCNACHKQFEKGKHILAP